MGSPVVSRIHTTAMGIWGNAMEQVGTDAQSFITGGPSSSDVQDSHGAIGYAMQNAFDKAHTARGEALGNVQADSAKISDTLRQAVKAYERGDTEAGRKLQAQAERMEGAQGSGAGGPGGPSAAGGGQDNGMQAASQMLGQFSQMAGQVMQGVTQPVQGIVQGLSQMPQQVLQGVQGIVQTATQGAGGGAQAAADAAAKTAGAVPGGPPGAGSSNTGEKAPTQQGAMHKDQIWQQRPTDEIGDNRPPVAEMGNAEPTVEIGGRDPGLVTIPILPDRPDRDM